MGWAQIYFVYRIESLFYMVEIINLLNKKETIKLKKIVGIKQKVRQNKHSDGDILKEVDLFLNRGFWFKNI